MEYVALTFYNFPYYNPQVAELLKNRHQIQPLIPMESTLPGFEGSSYTDAHERWDDTLWVSVRAIYSWFLIPPKQILPQKSSETGKTQVSLTLCFHWCSFTWENKVKAVSLPSFLSQLDSLSSPRNRVGERERWVIDLYLWHFALNGYLSSLISTGVKRGTRATGRTKRTLVLWASETKVQASRALSEGQTQTAKRAYSLCNAFLCWHKAASGEAPASWAQTDNLSWTIPCFCVLATGLYGCNFWKYTLRCF